jgi:hypothetical protein
MQVNEAFNAGMAEHLSALEAALNNSVHQAQASAMAQLNTATNTLHAAADSLRQQTQEQPQQARAQAALGALPGRQGTTPRQGHENLAKQGTTEGHQKAAKQTHNPPREVATTGIAIAVPASPTGGSLDSQFREALWRQAPEALLVPLCLGVAPENARNLSGEFRVCIAQQLVSVLPVAREEADSEKLIDWVTECLRDVEGVRDEKLRDVYTKVLSETSAAVKAIRSTARYRSQVGDKAAVLGTLVMSRQASL